jgi:hypothetical protein
VFSEDPGVGERFGSVPVYVHRQALLPRLTWLAWI